MTWNNLLWLHCTRDTFVSKLKSFLNMAKLSPGNLLDHKRFGAKLLLALGLTEITKPEKTLSLWVKHIFCNCCFIKCERTTYANIFFIYNFLLNFLSRRSFVLLIIIYDKYGSKKSHHICNKVQTFCCSYFLLWCYYYNSHGAVFSRSWC